MVCHTDAKIRTHVTPALALALALAVAAIARSWRSGTRALEWFESRKAINCNVR